MNIIDRTLDLDSKASKGPWKVISDIRPDVVQARAHVWWDSLPFEERCIWRDFLANVMINQDLGQLVSIAEEQGFVGGGQIVKDARKYPGHVVEFAKYWNNNDDAELVAQYRTDAPKLALTLKYVLDLLEDSDSASDRDKLIKIKSYMRYLE